MRLKRLRAELLVLGGVCLLLLALLLNCFETSAKG